MCGKYPDCDAPVESTERAMIDSTMGRRGFVRLAAGTGVVTAAAFYFDSPNAAAQGLANRLQTPTGDIPRVFHESPGPLTLETVEVAPDLHPDLRIVPRAVWGPQLPTPQIANEEDVRVLLVHHSAGSNDYDISTVPGMLGGSFSQNVAKNFQDIYYNFLVDWDGNAYEGRAGSLASTVLPEATGGSQGFSQIVCLLGNFMTIRPSERMEGTLVKLLGWMADRSNLDTTPGKLVSFDSRGSNHTGSDGRPDMLAGMPVVCNTIEPHRRMSATVCPGDAYAPYIEAGGLQTAVHTYRLSRPATPPPTVPPTVPPATTVPAEVAPPTTVGEPPVVITMPQQMPSPVVNVERRSRTNNTIGLMLTAAGGAALVAAAVAAHEQSRPDGRSVTEDENRSNWVDRPPAPHTRVGD